MQKFIFLTLFLFSVSWLNAQKTGNLSVTVPNVNPEDKGQILFLLFESEEGFPWEKAEAVLMGNTQQFSSNKVTYTFLDIPYGKYAVTVFHDKNRNKTIDTKAMGIPKEPYAASNLKKKGKPTFKKCVFDFKEKEMTIEAPFLNN